MPVPSQGYYGCTVFRLLTDFYLFIYLWVLTFPLEDCSVFGNFVITFICSQRALNYLAFQSFMSVHDEGYFRNVSCGEHEIYICLIIFIILKIRTYKQDTYLDQVIWLWSYLMNVISEFDICTCTSYGYGWLVYFVCFQCIIRSGYWWHDISIINHELDLVKKA